MFSLGLCAVGLCGGEVFSSRGSIKVVKEEEEEVLLPGGLEMDIYIDHNNNNLRPQT